jgi:hypothetical protein
MERFPWPVLALFLATPATSQQENTVELSELRARVARIGERVAELAGTDDLLDTLHFGWFDRPYRRATLAVLVKTTSALEREVHLRSVGNGAIADSVLAKMLSWAEDALNRAVAPEPHSGFRPHRLRIAPGDLSGETTAPPLYGFVDDATATRHDRRFGDLDVLVAAGLRVYPRVLGDMRGAGLDTTLFDRAEALGVAVGGVRPHGEALTGSASDIPAASPSDRALLVQPLILRTALRATAESPVGTNSTMALVDSTSRESLGAWLARRGLARGLHGSARYVIDSWQTPAMGQAPDDRAAATAPALWIDAIEGQSLGLLHGWRDLRDGSGSLHGSLFVEPWYIETVAHTALDIIRLGPYVKTFNGVPTIVVVIEPDAVDKRDDNAWSAWTEPIWETLLQRQVRFDVVPRRTLADGKLAERYRVVLSLRRADVADRRRLTDRIDSALGTGDAPAVGAPPPLGVGDGQVAPHITVLESEGSPAVDIFVREARMADGRRCVALVNLLDRLRVLKLRGNPPLRATRDLITDELIRAPEKLVTLGPWQVRLLCTEE